MLLEIGLRAIQNKFYFGIAQINISLGRTPSSLVSIHPYQNQDRSTFGSAVILFKSRHTAEIKSHQIQDA